MLVAVASYLSPPWLAVWPLVHLQTAVGGASQINALTHEVS